MLENKEMLKRVNGNELEFASCLLQFLGTFLTLNKRELLFISLGIIFHMSRCPKYIFK